LSGQRFRLDPLRALSYIGACILLSGCPRRGSEALVPLALRPADRESATAWVRTTLPPRRTLIRFRWRYVDERVSYAGRGTSRMAPPDSLRFDYAGPFGMGAGAAVVLGDSVAWADPAANFQALVPAIPMLWASLGVVRPPGAGAAVFRHEDEGTDWHRAIWRFVEEGDTLDYVLTDGRARQLQAEWRRRGIVVARSITQYTAGAPVSARIDFPEGPARFDLTVVAVDTLAVFTPALWRGRR
jgi:hypothetical protein